MKNNLAKEFNIWSLLKFTAPSTAMLVFMSLYQMVDGVFVANVEGENALSALNVVYPIPSIFIAIAIMLATGGSAIVARNMGEGKTEEAKENFSLIIATAAVISLVCLVLGTVFIDPIIRALGATALLYQDCRDYLAILILACPLAILQMVFQTFFVTAGRPHLGLGLTVIGGATNIALDYLFIVRLGLGVTGAALGTAIGYAVPALLSLLWFATRRGGTLHLVKPKWRGRVLLRTCTNGSSEMVTNLAVAITTLLFNKLMLRYLGETGVAAVTIVLYSQFLLTSIFMGYSGGMAPIVSYQYGSGNHAQIKRLFRMSLGIIGVFSALMFAISMCFPSPIISVFTPVGSETFEITHHGFLLFSFSYLFTGFNIFASGWFTAFSNGRLSAAIAFLRTFVLLILGLLFLPPLLEIDGIWLAVPLAELASILVSFCFLWKNRSVYHYG